MSIHEIYISFADSEPNELIYVNVCIIWSGVYAHSMFSDIRMKIMYIWISNGARQQAITIIDTRTHSHSSDE